MARAGLALGANLGDRQANLQRAIEGLRQLATPGEPVRVARIYQTRPCDCPPGSPDFLNTVVEIDWSGSARELLEETRAIEAALGRERCGGRNAPRTMDIDVLYLGDTCCEEADLVLPHPRISQRRFVLEPLADIRPELILPGQRETVAGLLDRLGG